MSDEINTGSENISNDNAQDSNIGSSNTQPVESSNNMSDNLPGYQKDPRWGKVWKDENSIYDTVKHYEKQYEPIRQTLDQYGYKDVNSLNNALEKYKYYTDPQGEYLKNMNVLNDNFLKYLNHDKYKESILKALGDVKLQEKRDMYGDLPDKYINQLEELNQFKNQTLAQQQQQQQQQQMTQLSGTLEKNLSEIDKFAKTYNLDINQEEMIKYAMEKGIDINY